MPKNCGICGIAVLKSIVKATVLVPWKNGTAVVPSLPWYSATLLSPWQCEHALLKIVSNSQRTVYSSDLHLNAHKLLVRNVLSWLNEILSHRTTFTFHKKKF